MPTIHDVAREAGVSIAAVSYVLNNSGSVSEETRRRVLQAVEKLNYRPHAIARGLQARKSRMIGYAWHLLPPDQFHPVLEQFIYWTTAAAGRHGYHVLTFPGQTPEAEIETYREMVETRRVDGFILSRTTLDDARIRYLLDIDFPFVTFGRANPAWDFAWVDVDGTYGVQQATQHLIDLGHRRIACLAWPESSLTGRFRYAGYCQAMAEAGIARDPDWVIRIENSYAAAYQAAQRWLALPARRRPTAVVALSDLMAAGVVNAATDAGLVVGCDWAVVGFDDAPMARFLRPPLTSLRQPVAQVAERMIGMLMELIEGQFPAPAHVLLKPELVVRASTKID